MFKIIETYEIISPESVEVGDVEDSGFGETYELDTMYEVIRFLDDRGPFETDSNFRPGLWYTNYGDQDFRTGSYENKSYHLSGFTPEQEKEIFDALTGKEDMELILDKYENEYNEYYDSSYNEMGEKIANFEKRSDLTGSISYDSFMDGINIAANFTKQACDALYISSKYATKFLDEKIVWEMSEYTAQDVLKCYNNLINIQMILAEIYMFEK